MLIEHIHLHMQVVADQGEFLLIRLLIGSEKAGSGLCLENWSDIPWQTCDEERWECIRKGTFGALRDRGIQDAKVCVVGVRYLDVDSLPSLFESVSRICVLLALECPETTFTESGQCRYLKRYKENNRDLLNEWDVF